MGNQQSAKVPSKKRNSALQDFILGSPIQDGQKFSYDKQLIKYKRLPFDDECFRISRSLPKENEFPSFLQKQKTNTAFKTINVKPGFTETPKSTLPTMFKWEGGGKQVQIGGTFSNWKTIPMVKSQGDFVTIVDIPEGEHEFKFCVDGEWRHDPKIKNVENGLGSRNNTLNVRKSDFEVFQALAKDSEETSSLQVNEYSQDIPKVKSWEKVNAPPLLPPHLHEVILAKDTPLSSEPCLLPEPNHVILNHLYAHSIEDSVMVISATNRYRKKYVTTLLYKPI